MITSTVKSILLYPLRYRRGQSSSSSEKCDEKLREGPSTGPIRHAGQRHHRFAKGRSRTGVTHQVTLRHTCVSGVHRHSQAKITHKRIHRTKVSQGIEHSAITVIDEHSSDDRVELKAHTFRLGKIQNDTTVLRKRARSPLKRENK